MVVTVTMTDSMLIYTAMNNSDYILFLGLKPVEFCDRINLYREVIE